jgi:aryl-alcohol dehydrogenase-like predicted oxidoreductase
MVDIPRRTLGRTGVEVTTLGFGAMELRGAPRGPEISDADAGRLLNAVLDEGINFIDTSIDYGRSEELIGMHLAHRRDEYFLASKCGCVPGAPQGSDHVHTPENIRAGVEHSLRTLKTDHLDLVQFHRSLSRDEFESSGALDEALKLRDEGKVRFVGVSATLPTLSEQIDMGIFDEFQIPYSALQREHENEISRAADAGMGIVIRGGVARGAPEDWSSRTYYMVPTETMRDYWEQAKLDDLLDGQSRNAFTLRFTLSHPGLDTTIVGTSSLEHLRDNIAVAAAGPLPEDVMAETKRRLAEVGSGPET